MTAPFGYSLSSNDYSSDNIASTAGTPGAGQRRSSYASVASFGAANQSRAARAGAVSHLLNPSSPDDPDDMMHRGFYSSLRDYERDMAARTSPGNIERPSSHSEMTGWPPKSSGLPRHSRAYDFVMSRDSFLPDELSPNPNDKRTAKFLQPSYLRGTVYMEKLEEQHKRRMQALKEGQYAGHTHSGGGSGGLAGSGPHSSNTSGSSKHPPPSHRGVTLDLVEKPPKAFAATVPDDEEDAVSPLPSRWNRDDKHPGLDVIAEGYDVKYTGPKSSSEKDHEACAIRADHWMPKQCGVYYYEVTVLAKKHQEYVSSLRPLDAELLERSCGGMDGPYAKMVLS
jgi:hypothetical protein